MQFKTLFHNGFTLLELVLVLFILAILTTTSLSFIESEDGQFRFQQSFTRFNAIEQAMLTEKASRGSNFLSGFIIDNGALPSGNTDLSALTDSDTTWSEVSSEEWEGYAYLRPYYYDVSNSERQLPDQDIYKLGKGFRGPYIKNDLDSDNELKDGWAFDFNITTSTSTIYAYTFDASSPITLPPFGVNVTDITRTINENDWSILPSSLNVTVNNNDDGTGSGDISDENFRLAVIVFSNNPNNNSLTTDDDDLWDTFYFDLTLSNNSSSNSSSETWTLDPNDPALTRIPAGEHLVLLLDRDATAGTAAEILDYARLNVFPSAGVQPEITLEFDPN